MPLSMVVNKEILSGVAATTGGDSEVMNVFSWAGGTKCFSCQVTYDVQSPAAAAVLTANITLSSDPTHPSEFNKTAHGFLTGLKVQATTGGTLAVPLALSTDYYVIKVSADYFALATSYANAVAGTRIAITNVGVTSTTLTPVALAGATITFNKSNDGTNYIACQAATSVAADGSVMWEQAVADYRYFKVTKALTAGQVVTTAQFTAIAETN